jgi:APA family basic amino acid/polyamine antiporter
LARQCATFAKDKLPLVCSNEALTDVLRQIGFSSVGNFLGLAAFIALPSVILILLFGQTRIFFVMSRDGLLPDSLAKIHPKWKTPYIVTALTGGAVAFAAAFLPVGQLADIANAGTLYAFMMVAIAVMLLRKREPTRERSFRTPALWLIGPATIVGCVFLFFNLPFEAMIVLPIWAGIGMVIYLFYSRSHSHLGLGHAEVHEDDPDAPQLH